MKPTLTPKKHGLALEMRTFRDKNGVTYLVFRSTGGSYHVSPRSRRKRQLGDAAQPRPRLPERCGESSGTNEHAGPNQALERTAARRTFAFQMNKRVSAQATLALGGGRSACSR
jgi:hypothetical protein